jgi:hypothetical protein
MNNSSSISTVNSTKSKASILSTNKYTESKIPRLKRKDDTNLSNATESRIDETKN